MINQLRVLQMMRNREDRERGKLTSETGAYMYTYTYI